MNTVTLSQPLSVAAALGRAAAAAWRTVSRWQAERRAAAQLHAMSDRDLADIGIHRSQIDSVVRGLGRR